MSALHLLPSNKPSIGQRQIKGQRSSKGVSRPTGGTYARPGPARIKAAYSRHSARSTTTQPAMGAAHRFQKLVCPKAIADFLSASKTTP